MKKIIFFLTFLAVFIYAQPKDKCVVYNVVIESRIDSTGWRIITQAYNRHCELINLYFDYHCDKPLQRGVKFHAFIQPEGTKEWKLIKVYVKGKKR